MRLIYITDSQVKAKSPEKRLDNFPETILKKFIEITKVSKLINAQAVIHGGDLFDNPRITPESVGQLAKIIRASNIPWYVVPGNHDLYGHNISTINQTMLGLLAKTGVINILDRTSPIVLKESSKDLSISIQGQEYYADIDNGNESDYEIDIDPTCDHHILVAHSMLLDHVFIEGINHTLIKDVKSDADLILAGHYHPGFPTQTHGNTTFINPGSMSRMSASNDDNRIPQYVILDIDKESIKPIFKDFKTAKPAREVLNYELKDHNSLTKDNINEFKDLLKTTNIKKSTDIVQILNDIEADTSNNVSKQMIEDCLSKIASVQLSKDDSIPKLDGYISSKEKIYITNISAKNFMSYKDLSLDLSPDLNVIIGESNSGKTTILRIIRWVQYGEPKGSDFISHWAKSVSASITYSNGLTIERSRTKASSGQVRILDKDGKEIGNFKGVKDNPINILNTCQMPQIFITKDEKRNIAFADQLETSFLVTDSQGVRASAIGRLTGLQDIDASIRMLNNDSKNISKEQKIKENILKSATKDLLKYNDLPNMKSIIERAEVLIEKAKETKDILSKIEVLDQQIISNQKAKEENQLLISSIKTLPDEKLFEKAENILKEMNELSVLESRIYNLNDNKISINNSLNRYKSIPNLDKLFNKLDTISNEIKTLSLLETQLEKVNTDKEQCKKSIQLGKEFIIKTDLSLDNILSTINICPTCNQSVNKSLLKGI